MPDVKKIWVGSVGPLLFDQDDFYYDDADPPVEDGNLRGFRTESTVICADPIENDEAVTRGYLGTTMAGYVPTSRLINTTLPLGGGGDLSADRTLVLNYSTDDLGLSGNNLYVKDAGIDHDATTNFVANEHMDTTAWAANLMPDSDAVRDLGASGSRWQTLYLSANLSDGTNELTVLQAKAAYDHSLDNTQAHSDYLLNTDDAMSGNLLVNGGNIGITDYLDLIQMGAGTLTLNCNLRVAADIGITSDTDLIGLALNALTVRGDVNVTGGLVNGPNTDVRLALTTGYVQLRTEANDDIYFDLGGTCYWRDFDSASATRMSLASATGILTVTGDGIFDGGDIGITSDPDLLGLALNVLTLRGALQCSGNLWLYAEASSYVGIRSGAAADQYYDAGGLFYWRDRDAAYATRMTLNSANGLLSPTTVQPTSGYNSVDASAGIGSTIVIDDNDGVTTHTLTFKNGILTAYVQTP